MKMKTSSVDIYDDGRGGGAADESNHLSSICRGTAISNQAIAFELAVQVLEEMRREP
jgi:hypothetical protein